MSRKNENRGFVCENCKRIVQPLNNGSYRNHCPYCLYSKHVDMLPGDRKSKCGGLMKPVKLKYKSAKGYQIIHRCLACGNESVNITAVNTEQPDDIDMIISIL